jgi:hypothetical protein
MKSLLVRAAIVLACATGSATAAEQSSQSAELLLSGPIEKVDAALGTVTIFGRDISTDHASDIAPGEIINVYGTLQKDGTISSAVVEPTSLYGSGGDPVYLKGFVSDVDAARAQIKIGGTTVDYTQELAGAEFSAPAVGQVIEVQATQPLVKGVLLASAMGANVVSKFLIPGKSMSTLSTQGSGVGRLSTQGSGVGSLSTQGSGIGRLSTQGSGIGRLSTQGSGIGSLSTQGSGIGSLSTQGSGVGSLSTQGSGIGSLSTQGSGVGSLSTQGSGIG